MFEVVATNHRPYKLEQDYLFPPRASEWLPKNHLVYFVREVVDEIDTSEFEKEKTETRGRASYSPKMMLGLTLYCYCIGERSSRAIERRTYEDVACIYMSGGEHPDHTSLSEFRRKNLEAMERVFSEVLRLCDEAGLVSLGEVALDGTKLKANASKHKAMSYARLKEKELHYREKVKKLLAEAEAADEKGKAPKASVLDDIEFSRNRLQVIRKAKKSLERQARALSEQQEAEAKSKDAKGRKGELPSADEVLNAPLPKAVIGVDKHGKPVAKAQENFTDAESRIQKTASGYVQGYNVQAAVDTQSQVVVANAVTNHNSDTLHLMPMLALMFLTLGGLPEKLLADAGYFSDANVVAAHMVGVEPYIPPSRKKHGVEPIPIRGKPPDKATHRELMRRKLSTTEGKMTYGRRKSTVEPVFGQIKEAQRIRAFLLRGISKVRGEANLIFASHNLRKLHKARAS